MDAADRDKKKLWKEHERLRAREAFPLPDAQLAELFRTLEAELETDGCDDTLRRTKAWALRNAHPVDALTAWLDTHGGFCDCEVLANVAFHWEDNRQLPAEE